MVHNSRDLFQTHSSKFFSFFICIFMYIILLLFLFIICYFLIKFHYNIIWDSICLYSMDPKTTEILEINKDIAHWQSDLENLMDFKNQLVHNWQKLGFSQEKYYNEMRDVEEQITQTKENISYFIKKKVDLQRELDIFKTPSVLGKRSGE